MGTHNSSKSKTLRTAGNICYILGVAFLIAALVFNVMPPQVSQAAKDSGAIWTTQVTCSTPADQDANSFAIGETVHIRGKGFLPTYTYNYKITGNPGGSSGDPNIIVASGTVTTDSTGYFCVGAYTVQPDDWGEYTVDVSDPTGGGQSKNDNYRVKETWTSTPENTPTNTPTNTQEPTSTNTPEPTFTNTPEPTLTDTPEPTATNTTEPTFTNTPEFTPTNTLEATATNTLEPTATNTLEPTATNTPETPPTDTPETPPTDTPETPPTNTPETPTDPTPEVTQEQPTTPATLPPPPQSPPTVLIPVTGVDLTANGLMGNLQVLFTNLGVSLLGLGLVLKGLARRIG